MTINGFSKYYLAVLYLFAAAREDATDEQLGQLRGVAKMLADPSVPVPDILRRVVEIRGSDWTPREKWVQAVEAL